MRNRYGLLAALARAAAVAVVALGIATPAAAQLGGLKKKLKATAASEATKPDAPAEDADAAAPAGGGGTVVLTADVLDRLVAGLEAGEAERQAAAKQDTPYGKHQRALAAYEVAKPKCQQGQQTFPNRMAADEKLADKYSALVDKMMEAQGRGDTRVSMAYNDSAMAMQDPNCVIKEPQQPDDFYQAQREVDTRAEKQVIETSGFSRSELGQVRERAEAILLGGPPPGGASASEKSAVAARAGELKKLLGIRDPEPVTRETAAAPPPAAAPAPAQPTPAASQAASAMGECIGRNVQKHEKEMQALGTRAQAAQQAGNTAALMAIADTLQRLQMAGCTGAR